MEFAIGQLGFNISVGFRTTGQYQNFSQKREFMQNFQIHRIFADSNLFHGSSEEVNFDGFMFKWARILAFARIKTSITFCSAKHFYLLVTIPFRCLVFIPMNMHFSLIKKVSIVLYKSY